jgi:hypothetical protein
VIGLTVQLPMANDRATDVPGGIRRNLLRLRKMRMMLVLSPLTPRYVWSIRVSPSGASTDSGMLVLWLTRMSGWATDCI